MHSIKVDYIPESKDGDKKNKVYEMLENFIESGDKIHKVIYTKDDYSNFMSVYMNVRRVVMQHDFRVRVISRCEDIYLLRE